MAKDDGAENKAAAGIAIMQPYFLPYLGYFALIASCETFIILDTVQYIRRGWMNRNRIPARTPEGWVYLGVPVEKTVQSARIDSVRVFHGKDWTSQFRKTVIQNYGNSPYFEQVFPLLAPIWGRPELLAALNEALMRSFAGYLGLHPRWIRSSELEGDLGPLAALNGEKLILGICKTVGAKRYFNLPGGRELYDPLEFEREGISLRFLPPLDLEKLERDFSCAGGFSILDLAMNHSVQDIRQMLRMHIPAEEGP